MQANRREFLRQTGLAAAASTVTSGAARRVAIILDPNDPVASSGPVKWAAEELRNALAGRQVQARILQTEVQTAASDLRVFGCGPDSKLGRVMFRDAGTPGPESLQFGVGGRGKGGLLAAGGGPLGLVYALLELADRVRYEADPLAVLTPRLWMPHGPSVLQQPANEVRSITRCFDSDVEDKPWFYDRAMWKAYLSMLAAQRFNRFSLTLGLGYNFPRHVTDAYFYFAYPFLVPVPGYDVRAVGLADSERDRNLEMLRFISGETAARGLHFQLGIWTHAYKWVDSPSANYTISGLTPANHAAYCRDALAAVLKACPAISGLTFRVHGESGIPEGDYSFWKTVFDGIVQTGRRIEIDMHAKGMDQQMIDVALATGMPVKVSPKYWAEHMGLGYQQAAIRELEMPPDHKVEGEFALSSGSRKFLRYSYGDLLKEGRKYGILYRIWPGTQRVLLWGDPATAAAYGRTANFCGSQGVEICEPLSFKGRMGSGLPGGRCGYADASLNPKYDWEKFLYTYRVWGRLLYNPDADPNGWRRYLRGEFRSAAEPVEAALANAGRILPLITTAHDPSASNNSYWPEMYTNMAVVDGSRKQPYHDSPKPLRFGTVSPLDPQLFSTVEEFAKELVSGEASGKYSPLDVAGWLENFSNEATRNLERAGANNGAPFRRMAADVAIQSGLGRFFTSKLQSAVLWAVYRQTGNSKARELALQYYRDARKLWADMAQGAKGVYASDITYGQEAQLRGHWLDRLPDMDTDIAEMEKAPPPAATVSGDLALAAIMARTPRPSTPAQHTPPSRFRPGAALEIEFAAFALAEEGRSARLWYRHVNQAEHWRDIEMARQDNRYRAAIPADYTQSPYPLQYYFELRESPGRAWLYPGFNTDLSNQPYFVVHA